MLFCFFAYSLGKGGITVMRQVAIVLLVVAVVGGAYYSVRSTSNPLIHRVAEGVTLEGKSIGGYTAVELGAYLDSVMKQAEMQPIQPQVDNITKGVIPGLAGRMVDRDQTITECLKAEKNAALSYSWQPVLPEPTPLDLPIYQGNPEKKQITFVVNVAWGNDELVHVAVPYFSPPYNDFDSKVIKVAASLEYQTVICSLDTADWMRPGVDRIVRRIVSNAHKGAIVLMHPTEQTPAALEIMITELLKQGYDLVPLSVLLSP